MAYLPLANVLHHKLASLFSALGIGVGICMFITLSGLTRGSLFEVARRWEGVDADLLVLPSLRPDDISSLTGGGLKDKLATILPQRFPDRIQDVLPVFLWRIELAGQDQMIAGATNDDLPYLLSHAPAVEGANRFSFSRSWEEIYQEQLEQQRAAYLARHEDDSDFLFRPESEPFARAGHFQMIIDSRLARAGGYELGQTLHQAGHDWTLVGIVPAGVYARAFIPRRTAQYLFASGAEESTVLFVRLKDGVSDAETAKQIRQMIDHKVQPLDAYRAMLVSQFGAMFVYVDAVNILAMVIGFLFIMVTLYTMVLQRRREIAILKASGASNLFIVRQVLVESLLLTGLGFLLGLGLSFLAAAAIETLQPLLTVQITPGWVLLALAAALAGACVSAIYPAYRASRVDMLSALNYE